MSLATFGTDSSIVSTMSRTLVPKLQKMFAALRPVLDCFEKYEPSTMLEVVWRVADWECVIYLNALLLGVYLDIKYEYRVLLMMPTVVYGILTNAWNVVILYQLLSGGKLSVAYIVLIHIVMYSVLIVTAPVPTLCRITVGCLVLDAFFVLLSYFQQRRRMWSNLHIGNEIEFALKYYWLGLLVMTHHPSFSNGAALMMCIVGSVALERNVAPDTNTIVIDKSRAAVDTNSGPIDANRCPVDTIRDPMHTNSVAIDTNAVPIKKTVAVSNHSGLPSYNSEVELSSSSSTSRLSRDNTVQAPTTIYNNVQPPIRDASSNYYQELLDAKATSLLTRFENQNQNQMNKQTNDNRTQTHKQTNRKQTYNYPTQLTANCTNVPDTWVSQTSDSMTAKLFVVEDGREKQMCRDHFYSTVKISQFDVVSVVRVQNLALWQSYAMKRNHFINRDKHRGHNSEKVYAFHGSDADTVPKICQQGFNRSFCARTLYGKGVYFARDANYSSAYAGSDINGIKRMFLCRVLHGEYCLGRKDANAPDVLDASVNRLYDSTVNDVTNPDMWVTYHDDQAYPEYIIEFKTTKIL